MKRTSKTLIALSLTMGWCTFVNAGIQQSSSGQGKQAEPGKQGQAGQQGGQPGGQAPPAKPSQEEMQAFQAIQNELDPDKTIQMVSDFEKKYPGSFGLAFSYLRAADAYRQKGDVQHVVEYGEKSLQRNGDNPVALILVASMLPEPQSLKGSDLDKEKKLSEAEEDANKAIKLIDQLPKQSNMTDEQFQKSKVALVSWAHSSLGMVHLQRSAMQLAGLDPEELAKAEKEYKAAVSMSDAPNPGDYFRLGEIYEKSGKTDDAIGAYSKAAELDRGGAIKQIASQAIERLKKLKKPEEKPPAKP